MIAHVAIAKRRMKTVAAGSITHVPEMGFWYSTLHGVVNGMVALIGSKPFDTFEEAMADANEALRVQAKDWVAMEEGAVDDYILANARNRWTPRPSEGP